ncbi:class I SAM-dependent methyltransferase [Nitriliruptoraceae bacterium ZYF776]|nr:class I SAM-dependent methyltransferase [Profundirhabdus halotolerans]
MAAATRAPAAPTVCPSGHRPVGSTSTAEPQSRQWAKGTEPLLVAGCRVRRGGSLVGTPRRLLPRVGTDVARVERFLPVTPEVSVSRTPGQPTASPAALRSDEPVTGVSSAAVLPAAGRDGKDAQLVQAMFDRVAPRYDLANAALSLGQDAHWRRVTARAARPADAEVLDVAAGPGNVAVELVAQGATHVTALDLSEQMLRVGYERGHEGISWVNGDALALPFPDASFDAVTISFGLRNIPDPEAAITEFARVLRPGGRFVLCEFANPTWAPFRAVYRRYLVGALPAIARVVSSSPAAYTYLAESILAWPDRVTLADWMRAAGFGEVQVKDLAGGIVAVHRGFRR